MALSGRENERLEREMFMMRKQVQDERGMNNLNMVGGGLAMINLMSSNPLSPTSSYNRSHNNNKT